uniref:Tau95_N domain-containing protein n=1 Tax=Syphacia muris TaxID=451379 RepID=A0A158R3W1_9BILA
MVAIHVRSTNSYYPRGIFQYRNIENDYDSNLKLPELNQSDDFEQNFLKLNPMAIVNSLFDAAVQATSQDHQVYGVKLPLPFGDKTINLQITRGKSVENKGRSEHKYSAELFESDSKINDRTEAEVNENNASLLENNDRDALNMARLVCLKEDRHACDQAMERYFQVRYQVSPMKDALTIRRSKPRNLDGIIHTGLAKWILPSLEKSLNNMVRGKAFTLPLSDHSYNSDDGDNTVEASANDDGEKNKISLANLLKLPVRLETNSGTISAEVSSATFSRRRHLVKLPQRKNLAPALMVKLRQRTVLPNREDVGNNMQ